LRRQSILDFPDLRACSLLVRALATKVTNLPTLQALVWLRAVLSGVASLAAFVAGDPRAVTLLVSGMVAIVACTWGCWWSRIVWAVVGFVWLWILSAVVVFAAAAEFGLVVVSAILLEVSQHVVKVQVVNAANTNIGMLMFAILLPMAELTAIETWLLDGFGAAVDDMLLCSEIVEQVVDEYVVRVHLILVHKAPVSIDAEQKLGTGKCDD